MKKILQHKQGIFYAIWTFFCSGYFLFWASNLKRVIDTEKYLLIVSGITVGLLALYIVLLLFDRPKLRDVLVMGGFAVLSAVIFIFFNFSSTLALLAMFAVAAYKLDFEKFVRFDIKLKIVWLIIILLMCFTGLTGNIIGTYGEAIKEAMGFQHPNTFGMFCFVILLEILFCYYRKMNVIGWGAVIALWYLVMDLSSSRTTGYSLALIIALFALARLFPNFVSGKVFLAIFTATPGILSLGTLVLTAMFRKRVPIAVTLNRILTHRLYLQAGYMRKFPVLAFGQDIDSYPLILDNAYLRILLAYGLIFFTIIILLYTLMMFRAVRNKHMNIAYLTLFFLLLGFGETSMIRAAINVSLLLLFNYAATGPERTD